MTTIEVKHNPKLDLNVPEFVCDSSPLGNHLNEYPMLRELNRYGFNGILGRPGSGKTSLLVSFLTGRGKKRILRRSFNSVILVMPTSSRDSMKQNPFAGHKKDKMFDELDYPTLEKIYNMLQASTAKDENTLLLLDDVGAAMKNKDIQKLLRLIIYNRRHLKVQIWCLLQSYISIPKEVRKLFTGLFIFKPSKVEFENIMDECFELKRDTALELMQFAYKKPHDYLFLSVENQKMYQDFDEVIVHTEDDLENKIST